MNVQQQRQPMPQGGFPMQQQQFPAMNQPNPQFAQQQPGFGQVNMLEQQLGAMNLNSSPMGKRQSKEEKNQYPSLYVDNLPKEGFLDLDFFKFFQKHGFNVKTAKVVLDRRTNKSRGYGYLQFYNKDEAERCLQAMNNFNLKGLQLRIVHSVSKFEVNEKANLLVKNIDKEATQQELYETFKQYGNIVSCKLETFNDGKSRGYAYIQFQDEEQADKAIAAMNDKEYRGKKLEVTRLEKRDKREVGPSKFNNLFVKNFPQGTDDAKLKAMFAVFGEIESATVAKNEDGSLKDFGYVCFKNPEHAEKAVQEMNKKVIGEGSFMIVNKHISKKDNEPAHGSRLNPITQNLTQTFNSNIYVKFIPVDVTEEDLRKKFTMKDSNILSVKLQKNVKREDGQEIPLYQYAYILYDSVQGAQKAIQNYHESTAFGGVKPLVVEQWVSKDEKEQERKKKESQQVNQFLNSLLNLTRAHSYPPQGMMGQQPMAGQGYQQNYNNRGGYNNQRGGQRGGRGNGRGRGYQQRPQPTMQNFPGQFPPPAFGQQMPAPYGVPPQGFPQQPMGMNQTMPQQVQLLPLPQVDMNEYAQFTDAGGRSQFVGNNIYPIIENVYGEHNAGKITGMLLDENVVNFVQLLTDAAYFTAKTREAMQLLIQSQQQQPIVGGQTPQ